MCCFLSFTLAKEKYTEHGKSITIHKIQLTLCFIFLCCLKQTEAKKKLNYTSVSSLKAEGVTFSAGIKSHDGQGYVTAYNSRNSMNLPFSGYEHLTSKEEIVTWLAHFPTTIPPDYEQKLNRLKYMKNHAVPYIK